MEQLQLPGNTAKKVINEKKQGIIAARERGFRESRGKILARTDADTIVPPDWLAKIDRTFKKYPTAVGLGGPVFNTNGFLNTLGKIYTTIGEKMLFKTYLGQDCFFGPNMALKKSAWKKTRVCGDENRILEDLDLSYHLSLIGKIYYRSDLKVSGSVRKLINNPLKGLRLYLIDYILNYFNTIRQHPRIISPAK